MMAVLRKKGFFLWLWVLTVSGLFYISGLHQYLLAYSFTGHYIHWGPHQSLEHFMQQIKLGQEPDVQPVNEFIYPYRFIQSQKCDVKGSIRLMYVIKSAPENFAKRSGIRKSWGFEKRFSEVEIRTVFLIGICHNDSQLQDLLVKEAEAYKDVIQADFIDSYYNNTIKTMMGLHWTYHYCNKVKYFLFVDDDYYVSTRNVLRFLRSPRNYPHYLKSPVSSGIHEEENLLAGYVFRSASPIRWYPSKWYISLAEYPYSHWPPYVTAGAYIVSRTSLEKIYFGSIYTYHFRFDDIFIGMAAKKAGLVPLHNSEFYFHRKTYSKDNFKWVIACHDFNDPYELQRVWNEQRAIGNA
ncbi:beta-1,3-galactosyltransferase brn-like isoform X2 [Oratosquilla oratoria]